jgi:hypothetical protein
VDKSLHAPITSFFSSVVERGIAAMQVILRSLFRSREGAVLLLFCEKCSFESRVVRWLIYSFEQLSLTLLVQASILSMRTGVYVYVHVHFHRLHIRAELG